MKTKKSQTILVLCAHPDDETLGLGGTLASHVEEGDNVHVMIFADGQFGRDNSDKGILKRKEQSKKACSILGVKQVKFLNYPDQKLEKIELTELSSKIEIWINKLKPTIVYTHYWGDVNQDHRRVFDASIIACRPQISSSIKELICFETPSSTDMGNFHMKFNPNYFVNIDKVFLKKIRALKQYKSELGNFPHPRSIEGIENRAKFWGQTIGVKKAEAFFILRKIRD
jgi:N-acetylglucosamine malate deacetylase 1